MWTMDSEGLNVRRLTTIGNYNDACAWNPAKQYSEIAYTARLEAGGFDIAVIDLATRQVRQITQGRGSCEYPSWAPERPPPRLLVQPRRPLGDHDRRPGGPLSPDAGHRAGQQRPARLGPVTWAQLEEDSCRFASIVD